VRSKTNLGEKSTLVYAPISRPFLRPSCGGAGYTFVHTLNVFPETTFGACADVIGGPRSHFMALFQL
jgi:hypothetical protein